MEIRSDANFQMKRAFLIFIACIALLAGCDNAESIRIDQTRAKLVGTWVRESEAGDVKNRRILLLGADGQFTERIQLAGSGGDAQRKEYAGEWSYDGIHLKRRFLREDGRQFSGGSMRYATFPLISVEASEFVVDDTITQARAVYRRAVDGAQL